MNDTKYGWVICLPANGYTRTDTVYLSKETRAYSPAVCNVQNARVFDGYMEANDYRSREVNDVWLCESQIKRVSLTPVSVQVKLAP